MAQAFGFTPEEVDKIDYTLVISMLIQSNEWMKFEDRKRANMIKSLFGGR